MREFAARGIFFRLGGVGGLQEWIPYFFQSPLINGGEPIYYASFPRRLVPSGLEKYMEYTFKSAYASASHTFTPTAPHLSLRQSAGHEVHRKCSSPTSATWPASAPAPTSPGRSSLASSSSTSLPSGPSSRPTCARCRSRRSSSTSSMAVGTAHRSRPWLHTLLLRLLLPTPLGPSHLQLKMQHIAMCHAPKLGQRSSQGCQDGAKQLQLLASLSSSLFHVFFVFPLITR
jgi:hypothetical protein